MKAFYYFFLKNCQRNVSCKSFINAIKPILICKRALKFVWSIPKTTIYGVCYAIGVCDRVLVREMRPTSVCSVCGAEVDYVSL